jgi:hypothetical protein
MAQADSVPTANRAPNPAAPAQRSTAPRRIRIKPADRRYFIGGSDARIIMGDDEGLLLRLWREKRGEVEPEDLSSNLIVQLGLATEDLNRRWYQANTGQVLADMRRPQRTMPLQIMESAASNSCQQLQHETVCGGGKRQANRVRAKLRPYCRGQERERQCRPEQGGRHNAYNENTLGCWLHWRNRAWHTRTRQGSILPTTQLWPTARLRLRLPTTRLPIPDLPRRGPKRLPAGLQLTGWELCAVQGTAWPVYSTRGALPVAVNIIS